MGNTLNAIELELKKDPRDETMKWEEIDKKDTGNRGHEGKRVASQL